jgi:hypothetical protein
MDPRWGSYDRDLSDLLDGTVSRKPLSGHSVLLIHKPAKVINSYFYSCSTTHSPPHTG